MRNPAHHIQYYLISGASSETSEVISVGARRCFSFNFWVRCGLPSGPGAGKRQKGWPAACTLQLIYFLCNPTLNRLLEKNPHISPSLIKSILFICTSSRAQVSAEWKRIVRGADVFEGPPQVTAARRYFLFVQIKHVTPPIHPAISPPLILWAPHTKHINLMCHVVCVRSGSFSLGELYTHMYT